MPLLCDGKGQELMLEPSTALSQLCDRLTPRGSIGRVLLAVDEHVMWYRS